MSPSWTGNITKGNEKVKEQEWENITVLEMKAALTKCRKSKLPGTDKVLNFWSNSLLLFHVIFTSLMNEVMQNPKRLLNGCAREQHNYMLKAMAQKTPKTIEQSLVFQQPKSFEHQF